MNDSGRLSKRQFSTNVVGVKNRSTFSELVPGLPPSACIDYMHPVWIDIYQAHLKLQGGTPETELRASLQKRIVCLRCELFDHGRTAGSVEKSQSGRYQSERIFLLPFSCWCDPSARPHYITLFVEKCLESGNLCKHQLKLI